MQEKEVVLSKIATVLSESDSIIKKNGEMSKNLSYCALKQQYTNNQNYLEPYNISYYNGGVYNNLNPAYDLFTGLDNIFQELYRNNDTDKLITLLKKIAERLNHNIFQNDYFNQLKYLYNIIGLDIEVSDYNNEITVKPFLKEDQQRLKDIFTTEKWLFNGYEDVYESYKSAIDSYKNGHFGTSIEACRTTLTTLFSKFKETGEFAKWMRGIANVSDEINNNPGKDELKEFKKNLIKVGTKDLSKFFEENIDGDFKKTKAIYSIYLMMSDYGTHRGEGPIEKPLIEDALMMIRMTEDIIIWVCMKKR